MNHCFAGAVMAQPRHTKLAYLFYSRFRLQLWLGTIALLLVVASAIFVGDLDQRERLRQAETDLLVLRAAFVQFDDVVQFARLFPNAAMVRTRHWSLVALAGSSPYGPHYVCRLPTYEIVDRTVVFEGTPTITLQELSLDGDLIESQVLTELTIDELRRRLIDETE